MSQVVLSKLQYVAVGMVYGSSLFTQEDMAHLSHCEVWLTNTTSGENALIASIGVYFDKWSYLDHKPSEHPADLVPADVQIAFMQDKNRKLTGEVSIGFFAEDTVVKNHLGHLRGW